ncbi:MAG: glycosyltransferase [Candidatus Electronema sp. V4]|uniref:glycosyltransferase n=1 Tax=Candidatus Electronema sp. V4 TaxID=3454756 RepID=UPI0040559BEF
MKILHVNTYDTKGGAARAMYRIHTALSKIGVKSEVLVSEKRSSDDNIKVFKIPFLKNKKWFLKKMALFRSTTNPSLHNYNMFNSGIYKKINSFDSDIVHLHWIGNELINISEIKKINKPIVWTLHDMWVFCSAEHYDDIEHPMQYQSGYREKKININAITWRRKRKHWQGINFHFVALTYWLAGCLQESLLFKGKKAKIIRNCLDIKQYCPVDRISACKKINIPAEKKIILFGADGKDANPLKGFNLLTDSFKFISDSANNFQFVVFGGGTGRKNEIISGFKIIDAGKITDEDYLVALYSAANVFVIPSMIDNYPNTVLEAMSCGTPCVGFKVGGIPEMIDHKVNGYLADPFDTKLLAEGIAWVLSDKERRDELGRNARKKIERECNEKKIAEEYKTLYESILRN